MSGRAAGTAPTATLSTEERPAETLEDECDTLSGRSEAGAREVLGTVSRIMSVKQKANSSLPLFILNNVPIFSVRRCPKLLVTELNVSGPCNRQIHVHITNSCTNSCTYSSV